MLDRKLSEDADPRSEIGDLRFSMSDQDRRASWARTAGHDFHRPPLPDGRGSDDGYGASVAVTPQQICGVFRALDTSSPDYSEFSDRLAVGGASVYLAIKA